MGEEEGVKLRAFSDASERYEEQGDEGEDGLRGSKGKKQALNISLHVAQQAPMEVETHCSDEEEQLRSTSLDEDRVERTHDQRRDYERRRLDDVQRSQRSA